MVLSVGAGEIGPTSMLTSKRVISLVLSVDNLRFDEALRLSDCASFAC